MFNRFTERARKVIVLAKEEARRFNVKVLNPCVNASDIPERFNALRSTRATSRCDMNLTACPLRYFILNVNIGIRTSRVSVLALLKKIIHGNSRVNMLPGQRVTARRRWYAAEIERYF